MDRNHNIFGAPLLSPSGKRVRAEHEQMRQQPYKLDSLRRTTVLHSIRQHCAQRGWRLLAAHVRSSHVHFVVAAAERPEKVLNQVKSYASRALNRQGLDNASRRRWTQHGSTRYLWKPEEVGAAVHYVVREQGQQMAVWESSG